MKNIHILPTDKPSRLRYNLSNILVLTKEAYRDYRKQVNQNIYITSDEEIKEKDWVFDIFLQAVFQANSFMGIKTQNTAKKIILTTDTDLIADGVQSIPEEFLEWFVKNTNCEFVGVEELCGGCGSNDGDCWRSKECNKGYFKNKYKIIIPEEEPKFENSIENTINLMSIANSMFGTKEEPKQEYEYIGECKGNNDDGCFMNSSGHNCGCYTRKLIKQETIEEAGKKYIETSHYMNKDRMADITFGANWQKERMYSEEELKSAFKVGFNIGYGSPVQELDLKNEHCERWFKQFKKK